MRETTRAMRERTEFAPLILPIAAGFGLFLAATGAFDTGSAPAGWRYPYWLLVMTSGGLLLLAVLRLTERPIPWLSRAWLRLGAAALLVCVAELPLVLLARALLLGERPSWAAAAMLMPQILLVSATAVLLVALIGHGKRAAPAAPRPAPSAAGEPLLARRLPPHLRGQVLLAVEAEDHYLRLHTSAGSCLLLMSLGEALLELEGADGARTHRSWWIARAAVRGVRRGNGRARLSLENGLVAPVSRTYARALSDAGWF